MAITNRKMSAAVQDAIHLPEIKFPEFTAKLIIDTFDALVAANIRQEQSYIEIVRAIGMEIKEFVNNTKDDINGEMILQFLLATISDPDKFVVNKTLSTSDATTLDKALSNISEGGGTAPAILTETTNTTNAAGEIVVTSAMYAKIYDAIAVRIAMDKHVFLKEMVKMGVLRIVVESGLIETKLTFNTYSAQYLSDYSYRCDSQYRSGFSSSSTGSSTTTINSGCVAAKTGWLVSAWGQASASASSTKIGVTTANSYNSSSSGSSSYGSSSSSSSSSTSSNVSIFGRVLINFKTDYKPLSST